MDGFDVAFCGLRLGNYSVWVIKGLTELPGQWARVAVTLVGTPKLHETKPEDTPKAGPENVLARGVPHIADDVG